MSHVYRYRSLIGAQIDESRLLAWTRAVVFGVAGIFVAAGTLLAVTIPFHVWDALGYGAWSRRVARLVGERPSEIAVFAVGGSG